MVSPALVGLGLFLSVAGAIGFRESRRLARFVVAADPFEGPHPADDPVALATRIARWVSGAVVLLGLGVAGLGLLG